MRTANQATIQMIKKFEGCVLNSYQDSVGVWTIGYGHTSNVGPGESITLERAESLLLDDVSMFCEGVEKYVKVPLTDNEFGALVSFSFNLGLGRLKESTLLKRVNSGKMNEAAEEFLRWTKAGGKVLPGLVARRAAERALFLTKEQV